MAGMNIGTNGNMSPLGVAWERVPLKRLIAKTVFQALSYKNTLEDGKGRNLSWVLPQVQPADTTPIVDGVPLSPVPVTTSTNNAVAQEYAKAFSYSSFLGNTSVIKADQLLMEQVTQAGAYTVDNLVRNVVYNSCTNFGVNLFAANGRTSIANIIGTDVLQMADLKKMHSLLEQNNVPVFGDGKMACVISVAQKYDITSNVNTGGFVDLAKQNNDTIKTLKKSMNITEDGEVDIVGDVAGLVLFATSLVPVVNNGTTNVHYAAAWGNYSLGSVELNGERFRTFRKEGSKDSGTYDITENIMLAAGYKLAWGGVNLSQDLTTLANQRIIVLGSAESLF